MHVLQITDYLQTDPYIYERQHAEAAADLLLSTAELVMVRSVIYLDHLIHWFCCCRRRRHPITISTGAWPYNRPCAQQYVGKSHSCMVISGRLIVHAPVESSALGSGEVAWWIRSASADECWLMSAESSILATILTVPIGSDDRRTRAIQQRDVHI